MTVTSTGWAGGWNTAVGLGVTGAAYSTVQQYSSNERLLNRALRKGYGGRRMKAILRSITGTVAGSSKAMTYKRVALTPSLGIASNQGGLVAIETISLATGNSTSGDVTHMRAVEDATNKPATYPVDLSGVRSGGRAGGIR